MEDNFAPRLARTNLASKNYITDFLKKTDFDDNLKKLNKKITSNKTKHVLVENKLNKPSKKAEVISTKAVTKDLMNFLNIFNEYFQWCKMFFFRNITKLFNIYIR